MSAFNWITVVDLELSELLRECVLLIACLESVTSHKPSQNTRRLSQECRTKPTVDRSSPDAAFLLCWSSSLFSAPPPLISVVESLLSVPLMISSLLPTGYVANFGASAVRA